MTKSKSSKKQRISTRTRKKINNRAKSKKRTVSSHQSHRSNGGGKQTTGPDRQAYERPVKHKNLHYEYVMAERDAAAEAARIAEIRDNLGTLAAEEAQREEAGAAQSAALDALAAWADDAISDKEIVDFLRDEIGLTQELAEKALDRPLGAFVRELPQMTHQELVALDVFNADELQKFSEFRLKTQPQQPSKLDVPEGPKPHLTDEQLWDAYAEKHPEEAARIVGQEKEWPVAAEWRRTLLGKLGMDPALIRTESAPFGGGGDRNKKSKRSTKKAKRSIKKPRVTRKSLKKKEI